MMTQMKPPTEVAKVDAHDPYKMRSLEQIISLFNNGDFLTEIMEGHQVLMLDLIEHNDLHGKKGCKGSMTIKIDYAGGNAGDLGMGATVEFKAPKKPPSSASAYINNAGELTLYNPMMARMHGGVRDATPHDPETGEVRDT